MANATLSIHNLSIHFGTKPLLERISLSIQSGYITALVGRSGSGKTLCALALQGLLPPNLTQTSGEILLDNTPLTPSKANAKRAMIVSILQNPRTCFDPLCTMKSHIVETLQAHNLPYIHNDITHLLQTLGLDSSVLDRYAFEMSGGELQRIMIAIALLMRTQFIIADEPTSDVDAIATQEILQTLKHICKEHNTGILLITHDYKLMHIAHRSYCIDSGKIIENIQGGFHTNFAHTTIYDREKLPKSTPPLITLRTITKAYRSMLALDAITLDIYAGQRLGIVGRSGSGKSTLAKIIARLELESSGEITYPSHWQAHKLQNLQARKHFYRHIQLLFQDPISALNPNRTIWASLTQGLYNLYGITDTNAQERRILPILDALDLDRALVHAYPAMLSGGQAARFNLVRALVVAPQLLILDETTSCLDSKTEAKILEYIAQEGIQAESTHRSKPTHQRDLSVLFITHNLSLARGFCDQIVLMDSGKIIEIVAHNEPFTSVQGIALESTHQTPPCL